MTTAEAQYILEHRGDYPDAMYLEAVAVIEGAKRQGIL